MRKAVPCATSKVRQKESALNKIVNEKLDQAVEVLKEQGLDAWLTFVRETTLMPDPCLYMVAGLGVTWHSAFLIFKTGERVAMVGRFDAGEHTQYRRVHRGYCVRPEYSTCFEGSDRNGSTR